MAKKADAKREKGKRGKVKGAPANRGASKGQGALNKGSAFKNSSASTKVGRTAPNGEKGISSKAKGTHLRSEATIKRLNMYKSKPDRKKMHEQATGPKRIQPDRRWFGNTRVIAQDKMQAFRETIAKGVDDPFSVVLKSSKLPMSLLKETEDKASRMNLLSIQPYSETFSARRQQKRVKLNNYDLEGMLEGVAGRQDGYDDEAHQDKQLQVDWHTGVEREDECVARHAGDAIFNKGTSRRIWAELYKVVDSSDVIVFVLDARDPMGTRCMQLERDIRKNKSHKHVVLVLNKVDLVPTWVSRKWVQVLMRDFPTLAFHASITNPFGKNALLNLLRQFSTLMKDKQHITVGMIGYPNVGKSSVINALRRKKVCKAAPVPGETRVWQYISLTTRLFLLDCPGIVPSCPSDMVSDTGKLLKGAVRAERVDTPSDYIDAVLARVKKQYLLQRYKLPVDTVYANAEEFLTILGKKMGKLFKGGEADIETTARVVLYDWQRGRIPYFTPPPEADMSEDRKPGAAASSSTGDAATGVESEAPAAIVDGPGDAAKKGDDADGDDAEDGESDDEDAASDAEVGADAVVGKAESSVVTGKDGKVQVNLKQKFKTLACKMSFDEEDARGEVPAGQGDAADGSGDEAAPKEHPAPRPTGKKRREDMKKRAKAAKDAGKDGQADAEAGATKKKKPRRGKGGNGGMGRPTGDGSHLSAPGSVDWGAVVSEFGM